MIYSSKGPSSFERYLLIVALLLMIFMVLSFGAGFYSCNGFDRHPYSRATQRCELDGVEYGCVSHTAWTESVLGCSCAVKGGARIQYKAKTSAPR